VLVPPRAIVAGVVPYPRDAKGTAVVTVELVVDRAGDVSDATVVEGAAPFTVATVEAARRWRFLPATRDGKPIPARIRMRVEFAPPVVVPPPPARGATDDVTVVTVTGQRPDPGQTTLGGGQVRQLPGAFGDAFRAIEALPGPVPMASGLPYYFIRGAPPGDTGYFIDGVRVPFLFHAAFGPSVIHPSLIDHLDFFPGGAPVEYGRFAGAVLSAALPEPAPAARAEGIVRVFDAGVVGETPFDGGRGSALVAGRYSYSGLILSLTSPIKLAYWDYQARATWNIDDKNRIGIFAFGSHDDFGQVTNGVTDTIIDGEFHRVDVRLDHALEHGTARVAATFGYARSNNDDNDIRDLTASLRATLEDRPSSTITVRAGADVALDRYDLLANAITAPFVGEVTDLLYPPHTDVAVGAYADLVWQVTPRVQLVPGVRADLYTSHRDDDPRAELASIGLPMTAVTTSILPAIDPRVTSRVDVDRHVALISAVGVAHQAAAYLVPVPGLTFVEPDPTLQTAIQMSQGISLALPRGVTAQATGFLHSYLDMTDLTATCPSIFGAGVLLGSAPRVMNDFCISDPVRGRAFGGELIVRASIGKRFSGWASYTLSRSTREASPVTVVGQVGDSIPRGSAETLATFDRTHVLNLVASYDLGAGWVAGARFVTYTGLPYSNTRDFIPVQPYNSARMPAFYRVDLRLEKRWTLGKRGAIALVFEGMNVTLNKEVLGEHCAPAPGGSVNSLDPCTPQTLGPVAVPSVGVEGRY